MFSPGSATLTGDDRLFVSLVKAGISKRNSFQNPVCRCNAGRPAEMRAPKGHTRPEACIREARAEVNKPGRKLDIFAPADAPFPACLDADAARYGLFAPDRRECCRTFH
tara:strand:- start:917 stop:1243 length:327 start_codon:yes stop_codon:yes gene_type:complete